MVRIRKDIQELMLGLAAPASSSSQIPSTAEVLQHRLLLYLQHHKDSDRGDEPLEEKPQRSGKSRGGRLSVLFFAYTRSLWFIAKH